MREAEIIDEATAKFREITGAVIKVTEREAKKNDRRIDGILDIAFEGRGQRFLMEVKNELRTVHLQNLLKPLEGLDLPKILLAQYIPPALREQLKAEKLNYLEATGNCYIQADGLFFFINDRRVTEARLPKEGKLWNATGLKFVFALLTDEKLLQGPYRHLAANAGIALGNVGPLLTELRNEGYLLPGAKGPLLVNREMLQDKWIELYPTLLRPKLRIGRYRKPDTLKANGELPAEMLWGGENAGGVLTRHLLPENHTIYTKLAKNTAMKALKLLPDPQGKLELLDQFWPAEIQQQQKEQQVVPPLIAYAELATQIDSRNRETAERIKQQYLDR